MKWILALLILVGCAGCVGADTRPLDGGCLDQVWVCRDIFCRPWNVCGTQINITYPVDNDTYYFPLITSELNFTLSGANSPTCYYKTTGAWNNCTCTNGDNTCGPVTWPEGYPLPITIRVDDPGCSSELKTEYIWVNYFHGAGGGRVNKTVWAGVLVPVVLCLLLVLGKKRRRNKGK